MKQLTLKSTDTGLLYVNIANEFRYNIYMEKWKSGDKIPSEIDLCKLYNVSRITIRRAIDELVKENLLYRKRAKGTYVLDFEDSNKDNITVIKTFTREMEELGKKPLTLNVELKKIKADLKISKLINVNIGDDVLCIMRLRGTDTDIFAYFKTYIPFNSNYSLDSDEYYGSLYKYLSNFGIQISQEREYIEAISANNEIQLKLKVSNSEPILKRVRMTSDKESGYYEYSECYYIGSKYRYYINFNE